MKTLKVKAGDSIAIGESVIVVRHVRGRDQIRLSIDAPRELEISHARAGGLIHVEDDDATPESKPLFNM